MTALLEVSGLTVEFGTARGALRVVDDVGFHVSPGETLGIVGESGSGKSVSSLAIMGLIPPQSGRVTATALRFDGRDLQTLAQEEMRQLRGSEMAMIFQEPMTSLNPVFTVGNQIQEAVRAHQRCSRAQAKARAIEMLDRVGIPDPARRMSDYPYAFSGGMRQRAMIAMALANDPEAAHRRRADDRARRDDPGADPRAAPDVATRRRARGRVRHPRSGRGRGDL